MCGPAFATIGRTDEELARAVAGTKSQIAFYASTPAYRPVLDLHGWGDLQPELTAMTKEGRWPELGSRIDDEMLHTFAVVGAPAQVGRGLRERFEGVATRISVYTPYEIDPALKPRGRTPREALVEPSRYCTVPGAFATDMTRARTDQTFDSVQRTTALNRRGQPDEVIGAALCFASDAARPLRARCCASTAARREHDRAARSGAGAGGSTGRRPTVPPSRCCVQLT